ncbi:MAG: DUF4230 domain-containing protein [Planctomycetota bacterium]
MKTIIIIVIGLLAVFSNLLLSCLRQFPVGSQSQPQPHPVVVKSQGPTIERLERLSHLVTSRVFVVDVLIGEGEGCRGAWLIRGDALLAVDLKHTQITEKNDESRKATITLPQPGILQPRVDHEKTKTWEVSRMTWLPWNANQDRLRDEVMLQAQRLVTQAAGSKENVEQAKKAAESIIRALYDEVGWNVKVIWAEKPIAQVTSDATAVNAGTSRR